MASSKDISRDEWLAETKELSPTSEAYEAYVELESFVTEHTRLRPTYRRNLGGESHYATFNGSARGHCSVIQMYAGQCELMWKWRKQIPGMSLEQHRKINDAFDRCRESLDGSPDKSWERVNVLAMGVPRVQEALRVLSNTLLEVMSE